MNNTITIYTQDQYPIIATLFEPENANGKLLLVNSATGVKQQTYYSFAQHFADLGFVVITYDTEEWRFLNQTSSKVLKRA